ncbi:hypothetical protein ACFXKD_12685 [Nocardiopsis aegyptia]|uniref:hypothetical protein n=1 Tax=Nocardiopsis aegyptia TaxID=220378 RepID=UPI00366AAA3B
MELSRIRRAAIVEAQGSGMLQDDIARYLGITPGRVSQMKKTGAGERKAPAEPTGGPAVPPDR